jgi:hypothetical protein
MIVRSYSRSLYSPISIGAPHYQNVAPNATECARICVRGIRPATRLGVENFQFQFRFQFQGGTVFSLLKIAETGNCQPLK